MGNSLIMNLFDLPNTDRKTQIFYQSGVWYKPPGTTMVSITCIGGGGGGGGGFTRVLSTTAGGGGGGGASGAIFNHILQACFIPDVLYVTVGIGGNGGVAFDDGKSGETTYVETVLSGGPNFVIARATGGGAGTSGRTTSVGGAAGTNTLSPASQQKGAVLGYSINYQGQSGGVGAGAVAGSPAYGGAPGTVLTGGAGGGSCPINNNAGGGGSVTGIVSFLPNSAGGSAGGVTGGTGVYMFQTDTFRSTGGGGGGANGTTASNSGNGGFGGGGAFGSGGGGGGAGTNAIGGAGGTGGRGGNGLVIIVAT